ncbi:MAG: hypothetical protein BGN92_10560 [Sphingobacteriales bacterium 41-5]|nr:MAG: hypothetical protein ABS67_03135 [Niabella sp. SCN 42-15]OJU26054.1 MAG: hypothetical protein BGN92_10560 [Sphingobacteriales bacterium 41-5]
MKLNYLIAAMLLPAFLWAQSPEKNQEAEQIIITRKGANPEKLNIIVDGDKVTVNGNPVANDDQSGDITVIRRKIKDLDGLIVEGGPGERRIIRRVDLAPGLGQPAPVAPFPPNKAMLGIATMKVEDGVKIMSVTKQSAADVAGLKEGDIVLEVERNKIEKPDDLTKIFKDKNPGDKVTILYLRDHKQHTAVATLKEWEPPVMEGFNGNLPAFRDFDIEELRGRLGDFENRRGDMQLRAFGFRSDKPKLGIKIQDMEKGSGVKVLEVETGSDAAKAGIKAGDVITEVDGKLVENADDMRMKVSGVKPGSDMQMKLNRNGKTQNLNIMFSKKIKTAEL